MRRRDPYENIKLVEELRKLNLNDYELVRILAEEAKRINQERIDGKIKLNEKVTTRAMRNLIEGKVKYIYKQDEE